jgi:Cellulase (glycosyl hydrolase family 5)
MDRRTWLWLVGSAAAAAAASSRAAGQASSGEGPAMHRYTDYGWLRGFSVVPSWGARVEEAWWRYHGGRFREEVALGRAVHANCIRLWVEFTAWMADPDGVTAAFLDAVAAIDESGMKTMPCLFNRWHDSRWDYGGQYTEDLFRDWAPKLDYVRALVHALASDARVLAWDLCNEPQAFGLGNDADQREYEWLRQVGEAMRAAGARQPITIGTMAGTNIETFAPLCDVLCAHPYCHTVEELRAMVAGLEAIRRKLGKPMLVNECIPGCLDDQRRADVARFYTETLSAAGLGWMGWALREGKAVSTRRDRYDANGLDGQGFHPFFTREGRLRAGLEFLTEEPSHRPPWVGTP